MSESTTNGPDEAKNGREAGRQADSRPYTRPTPAGVDPARSEAGRRGWATRRFHGLLRDHREES